MFINSCCYGLSQQYDVASAQIVKNEITIDDIAPSPHFFSIPKYKAPFSSQVLLSQLSPVLRDHVVQNNFDQFHPLVQFIDFYNEAKREKPTVSPLEVLSKFPGQQFLSDHGGYCYTLVQDLLDKLPSEIQKYSYKAVGTQSKRHYYPGHPYIYHVVLVIPFQNPLDMEDGGYILLDPALSIIDPVVVKKNGELTYIDRTFRPIGNKTRNWC